MTSYDNTDQGNIGSVNALPDSTKPSPEILLPRSIYNETLDEYLQWVPGWVLTMSPWMSTYDDPLDEYLQWVPGWVLTMSPWMCTYDDPLDEYLQWVPGWVLMMTH